MYLTKVFCSVYKNILPLAFVCTSFCGFIVSAEPTKNSIFELYPNPYRLLTYGIKNKISYEDQTRENLLIYLQNNCNSLKYKKENIGFCRNYEIVDSIRSYQDKIKVLVADNSLVPGKSLFIIASLLASNFEMDFLLPQDNVSKEVSIIIEYLKVQNQFTEGLMRLSDNFFDIHPGINIHGRTTVVPTYYAISSSASIMETLTRYLQVADCLPNQKLCNYYLNSLFDDYSKAVEIYTKDVLKPVDQILNFILGGNYGNFGLFEERVWMKDIHNSLTGNNFEYFLDKMLTSAGHVDDVENRFKTNYAQVYLFNQILNSDFNKIQEKSSKWKSNSIELSEAILRSDSQNIPFRSELLILMTQEISEHKKIIVDQIMQLDEEVQDVNY